MTINIKVTRERYEEVVSIDDDMHFMELTNKQAYEYMTQFVVNENGEYLSQDEARKLFKQVKRKDFTDYVVQFIKAVGESFVPPQNGADLKEPS